MQENIMPLGADTLLSISGMGNFQYQARDLTQTLSVIKAMSQQKRTVNGTLVDISNPIFRKYASKISCTDVDAPPIDGLFPGMIVTVDCAVALCYEVGNPGSPHRNAVSGSEYVQNHFVFYRPVLTMMVLEGPNLSFQEWKCANGWELNLEEV